MGFETSSGGTGAKPAATNAPVEDEAVQAVLGINRKPILFPCPGIFQPSSLPQKFPFLPPSPHFPLNPTQELYRAPELEPRRVSRHTTCKNVKRRIQEERFIPAEVREERDAPSLLCIYFSLCFFFFLSACKEFAIIFFFNVFLAYLPPPLVFYCALVTTTKKVMATTSSYQQQVVTFFFVFEKKKKP